MTSKYRELGKCIELIIDHRGKTPKKMGGDWVNNGVRTISAKNVHGGKLDNIDSIRCVSQEVYKKWMKEDIKRGDCLLASEGATLGENLYWNSDDKVVIGQRLYCIRTDNSILDSKYFSAYMNTHEYQKEIEGRATGTSVLGIKQTDLLKTMVLIKDIEEQRFIGNLYFEINDKIETNNRINKKLEEMAQSIFKKWFVEFEFPNEDGEPYKSSGGEMFESEIGIIPKNWKVEHLGDLVKEIITGKTPPTKNAENYGDKYPFITIPDMHNNVFLIKTERYLSETGNKVQIKKLLPENSIVVSCIATVGLVGINASKSHTNQQINSIVPKKDEDLYYFYEYLKLMSERLKAIGSTGSTTLNVNKKEFEKIKYSYPTDQVMKAFNKLVKDSFEMIKQRQIENEILINIRETLLPKLMSGEIRVPINN